MNYPTYLGHDPSDVSHTWPEWQLQAWIVTQCHRAGLCFSAGQEGAHKGRVGGAKAKLTGQVAGEPDLRFYLPISKLVLVELKTLTGKLSKEQVIRHKLLSSVGFMPYVVHASSPVDGWQQVRKILCDNGAMLDEYYPAPNNHKDG